MHILRKSMRRGLLGAVLFVALGSVGGCAADSIMGDGGDDPPPPPPGCTYINGQLVCP